MNTNDIIEGGQYAVGSLVDIGKSAIDTVISAGKSAIDNVIGVIRQTGQDMLQGGNYPSPIFRITVNGADIAQLISPRLISLSITDNRGIDADTVDISLSDDDGLLSIPPKGATIQVWLGWSDTGLVDKGTYTVDETEHSGAPDVLNIRARSADLRGKLKIKRENSWSDSTVDAVIFAIAVRNGLDPVTAKEFHGVKVVQLDQANESDANLLTRLGEQYDAIATIKAGRLLFMPASGGKTASGASLEHIVLTRADGDSHRFLQADRESYDGVKSYYYDINSAKKQFAIAGGGENLKELRHTYSDMPSALRAARAEWNRLQRGSATLSYTLAKGRPELIPELTYSLEGVKWEIDAIIWHGGNVQHSLTADAGYITSLELESKLPEDTVDDLYEEGPVRYTGVIAYYRDKKTGQQKSITEGDQTKPKRLSKLYAAKAPAERAVKREAAKIKEADA